MKSSNCTPQFCDWQREKPAPPFVIPVFISHQGCPHRCIFCNQTKITGCNREEGGGVTAEDVRQTINDQLAWPRKNANREVQVAFYGGSFTGLSHRYQEELLGAVRPFIEQGKVQSIRLSTRPDYIQTETGSFLREKGVGVIELGIQSMDPKVLLACHRGHSVEDSIAAVHCLKKSGMRIGVQVMVGLPGETTTGLVDGIKRLADLRPDFARIYPLLILKESGLAGLWLKGDFQPLTLNQAIARTARVKAIFDNASITVVRMGLQETAGLADEILAGPYHPAFGELVLARLMFRKLRALLSKNERTTDRLVRCAAADRSIVQGFQNRNQLRLAALGLLERVEFVFVPDQERFTIMVSERNDRRAAMAT